ncbi:hypothetical protein Micbo1qcDRAFT_201609 [Microdochium bolleyi]|uniref:Zn(2)-C6 fungal-type domain-containing protein n=1 Tax=Microdochium bolleyi TaxID=196109 RepID=A0A136J8Z6_9PEZI|nr:hypothetical protein Micbo1qcDRAFT_201609 [Microdochium bolleyi]
MTTQQLPPGRPKPMRLGTKSCLECRRRKVRCIVAPDATRCRQCILHKIRCVPQGPRPSGQAGEQDEAGRPPRQPSLPLSEFPRLKAVLDNISVSHSIGSGSDSVGSGPSPPGDSAQSSRWLASALESLLSDESDKTPSSYHHSPSVPTTTTSNNDTFPDDHAFAAAPLLHYLRNTLITPSPSGHSDSSSADGETGGSSPGRGLARQKVWLSLIPARHTLQAIFETTQPFWSVWPLPSHFPHTVAQACAFVGDQELHGCTDGGAAKRLAWLALCISQLPWDFQACHAASFADLRPAELAVKLLDISKELATASLEHGSAGRNTSLDSLEALAMQYKCLLNQGRPRQGWKCARLAIDNALLMGLHRSQVPDSQSNRGQQIWTALWRADRQMALFLGVPYSVPAQFRGFDRDACKHDHRYDSKEDEIFELATSICEKIVERDHAGPQSAYSRTARIMEDMDEMHNLIPKEWWLSMTPSPVVAAADTLGGPLGQLFWQSAILFFYHYINHLLHLPYVLTGNQDPRHHYNRDVALASAEGMLLAFVRLPTCNGLPVVCDWLDFAAFSGAIVLVADLLSGQQQQQQQQERSRAWRLPSEEERLWALVADCAKVMRRKSGMLNCVVSGQSADLLERLHAARHGVYSGPTEYETVIPYFGRVRIRCPQASSESLPVQRQQQYQQQWEHEYPRRPGNIEQYNIDVYFTPDDVC